MPFPLDEIFIEKAEAELGARLPRDYRMMMMEENGGCVIIDNREWYLHPIRDASDKKRLSRTCNDIITETKNKSGIPEWKSNWLDIASDQSGDYLVILNVGNVFRDQIFVYAHEENELIETDLKFADLERE